MTWDALRAIADAHAKGHGMWLPGEWAEFTRMCDALDWQAVAAVPSESTIRLDVERLARAMFAIDDRDRGIALEDVAARDLAAEYARLARPVEEPV